MAFSVTEFASQGLPFGGARSSLFEVDIQTPAGIPNVNDRIRFTCRAAQIPAATINNINVNYFGREIKVAGNRTFAEWTPTILNDEDFQVRDAMEAWSNSINSFRSNLRDPALATLAGYRTDATVIQYGKTGNVLRRYKFVNLYPTEVSTIDLAWDSDAIQEFTVTFQYDYWEAVTGTAAPGVSFNANL
jgi:hypothetical protein